MSDPSDERAALYEAIETLSRLTDGMERRRQQLARSVGLSPQQWRVLEEIGRQDFMPSLFARSRDCSAAAVSRTLRQLQGRGLVRAAISSEDGRRREYALTRSGEQALRSLGRAREQALEAVWRGLDPDALARFARFGGQLADRLTAYADAAE